MEKNKTQNRSNDKFNDKSENQNSPSTDDSFNGNLTAIPKTTSQAGRARTDLDLVATPMDAGTMNTADAEESGYTDEDGRAVSQQKANSKTGSPTGAYTDIGAGRSSAVRSSKDERTKKRT